MQHNSAIRTEGTAHAYLVLRKLVALDLHQQTARGVALADARADHVPHHPGEAQHLSGSRGLDVCGEQVVALAVLVSVGPVLIFGIGFFRTGHLAPQQPEGNW